MKIGVSLSQLWRKEEEGPLLRRPLQFAAGVPQWRDRSGGGSVEERWLWRSEAEERALASVAAKGPFSWWILVEKLIHPTCFSELEHCYFIRTILIYFERAQRFRRLADPQIGNIHQVSVTFQCPLSNCFEDRPSLRRMENEVGFSERSGAMKRRCWRCNRYLKISEEFWRILR